MELNGVKIGANGTAAVYPIMTIPALEDVAPVAPRKRTQRKERAKNVTRRYREMALRYATLPMDSFLIEDWGTSDGAITVARVALKKEGFEFQRVEGGWKVVTRPAPKADPEPEAAVEPVAAEQPEPEKEAAPGADAAVLDVSGIEARLDRVASLLERLLVVWGDS